MTPDILDDLDRRGVRVTAFIVQHDNGDFQYIAYNDNDCVTFLSERMDNMVVYEERPGGGMVGRVSVKKQKKDA